MNGFNMKKILLGVLILAIAFVLYKVGSRLYFNYQMDQFEEQSRIDDFKINQLVSTKASEKIKTTDLVYLCELRKELWDTDVSVDDIQKSAELNNKNYKNFITDIKTEIKKDNELSRIIKDSTFGFNTEIVGQLCTLKDPDSGYSRSIYNKLLYKKYKLNEDSISYLNENSITQQDLNEYLKAMQKAKEFRLKY